MHIVASVCSLLIFFPPPAFFSVDPETPTDQEPYPSEDQFASAELPGKQPLLDHSDITHSFSLLLALDFVITVYR